MINQLLQQISPLLQGAIPNKLDRNWLTSLQSSLATLNRTTNWISINISQQLPSNISSMQIWSLSINLPNNAQADLDILKTAKRTIEWMKWQFDARHVDQSISWDYNIFLWDCDRVITTLERQISDYNFIINLSSKIYEINTILTLNIQSIGRTINIFSWISNTNTLTSILWQWNLLQKREYDKIKSICESFEGNTIRDSIASWENWNQAQQQISNQMKSYIDDVISPRLWEIKQELWNLYNIVPETTSANIKQVNSSFGFVNNWSRSNPQIQQRFQNIFQNVWLNSPSDVLASSNQQNIINRINNIDIQWLQNMRLFLICISKMCKDASGNSIDFRKFTNVSILNQKDPDLVILYKLFSALNTRIINLCFDGGSIDNFRNRNNINHHNTDMYVCRILDPNELFWVTQVSNKIQFANNFIRISEVFRNSNDPTFKNIWNTIYNFYYQHTWTWKATSFLSNIFSKWWNKK